jgi:hypothetical protein
MGEAYTGGGRPTRGPAPVPGAVHKDRPEYATGGPLRGHLVNPPAQTRAPGPKPGPASRGTTPIINIKADITKALEQLNHAIDKAARSVAWATWRHQVGVLPVDVNKTRQAFYAGWDAHRARTKKPKETP